MDLLFFLCQICLMMKEAQRVIIQTFTIYLHNGAIYWVVPMKVVDELSPDEKFYQNADLCSGQLIVDSMAHTWLQRPLSSNEDTEAK